MHHFFPVGGSICQPLPIGRTMNNKLLQDSWRSCCLRWFGILPQKSECVKNKMCYSHVLRNIIELSMTYIFVEGAAEHILNFTFSHLRLLKCSSNNFKKNKKKFIDFDTKLNHIWASLEPNHEDSLSKMILSYFFALQYSLSI